MSPEFDRATPPDNLVQQYDFVLDGVCPDCPEWSLTPRFLPGFGVKVFPAKHGKADIVMTDLYARFNRDTRGAKDPGIEELKRMQLDSLPETDLVEMAFQSCKKPEVEERTWRPDKKICGALALLQSVAINEKLMVREQ